MNLKELANVKSCSQGRPSRSDGPVNELIGPNSPTDDTAEIVAFDVTSIVQRSSPWPCNSVEVEMKFHLECKFHFSCAQLMLRQMHFANVSESIEAKY